MLVQLYRNMKTKRQTNSKTKLKKWTQSREDSEDGPKIDFKEDAKGGSSAGQSQVEDLEQVSRLAILLRSKLLLMREAEARLTLLQQEINRIKLEDLPALMDQFNLLELKLKDGSRLVVKPLINASLPSEGAILRCKDGEQRVEMRNRLKKAFQFLRKQGAAALIKTQLKADFGKDSEKVAEKALKTLQQLGVNAEVSKGVHPQTLNAWVRERIEAGKPVDMETFRVFSGQVAEITTPNTEETF